MTPSKTSARIAALNDQLRRADRAVSSLGSLIITPGIRDLEQPEQIAILYAVRTADFFPDGNDPYSVNHDFGSLDIHGKRVFWKIDYYDRATYGTEAQRGSDDPSDPDKTYRVLTTMLAEEY